MQRLGDELDAEKLLQMSNTMEHYKKRKNLTTKIIFQMLKDGSKKNVSTWEIFMKWLQERDKQGLSSMIFRFDELEKHGLFKNNFKWKTFCTLYWFFSSYHFFLHYFSLDNFFNMKYIETKSHSQLLHKLTVCLITLRTYKCYCP